MANVATNFIQNCSCFAENQKSILISAALSVHLERSIKLEKFKFLAVIILTLIIVYAKYLQQRRLLFSSLLPRVKWTRFELPVTIDGFISLSKLRKNGVRLMDELVTKYGPIFRFPFATTEVIAVSDPCIIQKLLNSTNVGHLNKPRQLVDIVFSDCLKSGLLLADVDSWSPHRKAISRAFTYNSFPTYLKYIHDEAKELAKCAVIASSQTCDGTINNTKMKTLIDHHSLKITTHIIMGSESFNITDNERSAFHENFRRGKELALDHFLRPELMIRPIWLLHPKKRELDNIIEKNIQFSYRIINHYRAKECKLGWDQNYNHDNAKEHMCPCNMENVKQEKGEDSCNKPFECLVEKMISAGLSNKEIADEVGTFLIAGHETMVIALELLIFHLAKNTEHQKKCRLEVDNFFNSKSNGEKCWNMEDLSGLKYLERCIFESLRLTPTIPFIVRRLDTNLEVKDGCVIEAGRVLLMMPWILHRNPEIYPNPSRFDPDRFLPENVRKRHSHSFIPFSMGMRNCVGWKIALLEMKVIMAFILRNFRMSTTDELDNIKLLYDITLKTERQFNVIFKKRAVN